MSLTNRPFLPDKDQPGLTSLIHRQNISVRFFCDESGQTQSRFCAIGGIVCYDNSLDKIEKDINSIKSKYGVSSEVKWTKAGTHRPEMYEDLVDYFFELNAYRYIDFHILFVEFAKFNHKLRPDGRLSESVNRLYYQLCKFRLFSYKYRGDLYWHLDKSTELNGLLQYIEALNVEGSREKEPKLKEIILEDSEERPILQLNDIILGGLNYIKNNKHLESDASVIRKTLAEKILLLSQKNSLDKDSGKTTPWFTVWNFIKPPGHRRKYLRKSVSV